MDQAHAQINVCVKEDGGIVRPTENPNALIRWMVAGNEIACMIREFEDMTGLSAMTVSWQHHKQTFGTQVAFTKETLAIFSRCS